MVKSVVLQEEILKILLESKVNGHTTLYYSQIYNTLKKNTGRKISYRDYSAALQDMENNNRLQKEERYQGNKRIPQVFYSLTANAVKEHQNNILGINLETERLRKLYQLLFVYETTKYGLMKFTRESFDNFLELAQRSEEDLKVAKQVEILDGKAYIIIFEPVNGIEISKFEDKQMEMTIYIVTYPGFSIEEILSFHKKSSQLFYSYNYPMMFGHIQFTLNDLMNAFRVLKKADLIRPISIFAGDQGAGISTRLQRYTITDNRVKQLIHDICQLYQELQTILFMKYYAGELEDRERSWLNYLFGIENTEKILQDWKSNEPSILKYGNEPDKDIEITKTKGKVYGQLAEIKQRFSDLNKKYSHVIQEYDFPLNPIIEILTPVL